MVEKVVRSAAVYLFLPVGFRLADKRQLGSMMAFDLAVLLVTSKVVQNALTGNDSSLGGGLLGATPILGLNSIVAWATFRYRRMEGIVEHTPTLLLKHRWILHENLRREHLSLPEQRAALRREGLASLRDVHYVLLEEDGHLSVIAGRAAAL